MQRSLLVTAGFAGSLLDTKLGINSRECLNPQAQTCLCHPHLPARAGLNFADAVGDVGIVDDKWGPSIGPSQIRSLRRPQDWPYPDSLRIASKLLDPAYNAMVAFALFLRYGFRIWSVYQDNPLITSGDFELHWGHFRSHLWNV